jgi:quercetin dioxygenase-like cupin family protein
MSEIINLFDIDYQDEINKKFVFDNEQSSLTLLAFKAGTSRDIHTDEKDEVAHILEGLADITIGGKVYNLKKNEMIVMPAKVPHGLKAITNTKLLLLRPKHKHMQHK